MSQECVVRCEKIIKDFPGVRALESVDVEVYPGETLGFAGANGAGKSTLIKIINGMYAPDSGRIFFEGKEVDISSPKKAHLLGIHTTYQEVNLVREMTVSDNIFLGQELTRNPFAFIGMVDRKRQIELTNQMLEELGIANLVSADMKVGGLGSIQLGIIQIARAVARKSKLLIMDEPTSLLSRKEIDILFETISKLRRTELEMAVIFITHRLEEFCEICGRVVVLRDGKVAGSLVGQEITVPALSDLMIGRIVGTAKKEKKAAKEGVAFEVGNLSLRGVLNDINFSLRKGEIVGLAGLVGAGKTELMLTLFGAYARDSGKLKVNGREVNINSPGDAINLSIGLVPEERKLQGLFLDMMISQNITISGLSKISKCSFINRRQQNRVTDEYIDRLSIDARGPKQLAGTLSGGNQQKVVLSKWMMLKPKILLVDEVTRGIDVGAKEEIRRLIKEMSSKGASVLMSATEVDEILALSDRVLVMADGRIIAELETDKTNKTEILKLCLGERTQ